MKKLTKKESLEFLNRAFALFVIYLFMVSGVSVGVKGDHHEADYSVGDNGFYSDTSNIDVTSANFDMTKVSPTDTPAVMDKVFAENGQGFGTKREKIIYDLKPNQISQIKPSQVSKLSSGELSTIMTKQGVSVGTNNDVFQEFVDKKGITANVIGRPTNEVINEEGTHYLVNGGHRLDLNTVDPDTIAIIALEKGTEDYDIENGFLINKGEDTLVIAGDTPIKITTDENGNTLIQSFNIESGTFDDGQYVEKGKTGTINIGDYELQIWYEEAGSHVGSRKNENSI